MAYQASIHSPARPRKGAPSNETMSGRGCPPPPALLGKSPQAPVSEFSANRGQLIPATAWNQHHAWPPIGGLRHLIFHATSNGFDKVIRRVGRRVLIDEAAFFAWVDNNGGAK